MPKVTAKKETSRGWTQMELVPKPRLVLQHQKEQWEAPYALGSVSWFLHIQRKYSFLVYSVQQASLAVVGVEDEAMNQTPVGTQSGIWEGEENKISIMI